MMAPTLNVSPDYYYFFFVLKSYCCCQLLSAMMAWVECIDQLEAVFLTGHV